MEKFKEIELKKRKLIGKYIANWLKDYTQEVILRVMEKREEIVNNEFTMNLLKELYVREVKEVEEFTNDIILLLENFEEFKQYDTHSHIFGKNRTLKVVEENGLYYVKNYIKGKIVYCASTLDECLDWMYFKNYKKSPNKFTQVL